MSSNAPPSWVETESETRVVWRDTPTHWQIADRLLAAAIAVALGVYGAIQFDTVFRVVSIVVVAGGLLGGAVAIIHHRRHIYLMTETELYKRSGMFSLTIDTLSLRSVQNTSYSQSPLQRLLNVGTVEIETAGTNSTELVLEEVPRPSYVANLIIDHSDGG
ncbi:PH domain-containing protein [Halocatena halophila]|uniref:PH domain-containing protein n=1 Tax=Halocatena halophila TaxID=2814576 RepID=UPI002ED62A22